MTDLHPGPRPLDEVDGDEAAAGASDAPVAGPDRSGLARLGVLVLLALVSLATVVVLRSPILDVDEVRIDGAVRTDPTQVVELVGIEVGSPILLADLDGARERLSGLPWVASVQVTRDLPGTVLVRLVERTPVAVLAGPGRAVLVDASGRVVAEAGDGAAGLLRVAVAEDPPAVGRSVDEGLRTAVALADRFRADPPGVVAGVAVTPSLRLLLAAGGFIDLGDATGLEAKVEAVRTALARIDLTCAARIDVRVPTHPVLTRNPACS